MSVAIVKRGGICAFPQWPVGAIPPVRIGAYGGGEQLSGEASSTGVPTQLSLGAFVFALLLLNWGGCSYSAQSCEARIDSYPWFKPLRER